MRRGLCLGALILCLAFWDFPVCAEGRPRDLRPIPMHTICADVMRELFAIGVEEAKLGLADLAHKVKTIPWLRVFLKEAKEDDLSRLWGGLLEEQRPPAGQRWYGWLTQSAPKSGQPAANPPDPKGVASEEPYRFSPFNGIYRVMADLPNDLVQALPRLISKHLSRDRKAYDIRPIHMIYEWGIRKPVEAVSGRISQKRYQPSGVLKFIGSMALYAVGYGLFEDWFRKKVKEREHEGFLLQASEWQRLIDEDYRFSEIKDTLKSGKVTPERAREMALTLDESYKLYFRYVAAGYGGDSPEVRRAKLLANPLFSNVRYLVDNGIEPEAGFELGPKAPPDDIPEQTVDQLIQIDHLLFAEYQVIPSLVRGGATYDALKDKAGFKDIVNYMEADRFYLRLRELRNTGKISDDRFIYLLMEDAQWQAKFRTYDALDMHRLKIDGKGGFTNERLTLDEIRGETMEEIGVPGSPGA